MYPADLGIDVVIHADVGLAVEGDGADGCLGRAPEVRQRWTKASRRKPLIPLTWAAPMFPGYAGTLLGYPRESLLIA